MKISCTCFLLFFSLQFPSFIQVELDTAFRFLDSQKNTITSQSDSWAAPPKEVLSIISPELIRYNLLRDFFETQALEVAYLNFGKEAADFSIGHFQMKPSFVEKLEVHLSQNPDLKKDFQHLIPLPSSSEKANRQQRLERLQSFRWQLEYAYAFYQIGIHRFKKLQSASPPARVAFLATAYNFGFEANEADIRNWQSVSAFPYGKKYQGKQVAYAELALAFFEDLKN